MKKIIMAVVAALLTLCAVLPINAEDTAVETASATEAVTEVGAAEEVRRQTVDEVASEIMAIAENASPEEIRYIRNKVAEGVQYLDAHGLDRVAIVLTNHSETVALCALLVAVCIYAVIKTRTTRRLEGNVKTVNDNFVEAQNEFIKKMESLCKKLEAADERNEKLIAVNDILRQQLDTVNADRIRAEGENEKRLTSTEAAAQGTLRLLAAMTTASDKLPPDLRDRLYTIAQNALKGGEGDEK